MPALPKLSYVLLSHNREKYIRRAIESAFAQDYEGELEYIFSDDCSTDRTFEIIKECVAEYKGGRRVVVTQTPHNCHLAGNTNHAVSLISPDSDWVIRADDDDIACTDRCSIIGKAIAEHPEATYVYTRQQDFTDDQEEDILAKAKGPRDADHLPVASIMDVRAGYSAQKGFCRKNCSHQAWSAKVYRQFGPLPLDAYYVDDVTCCWRANFLGVGLDIPVVTMYIRIGSLNMCRGGDDGGRGYAAIKRQEEFNDKYQNTTLPPLTAEYERLCAARKELTESEAERLAPYFQLLTDVLEERRIETTYWRRGMLNRWRINRKRGKNRPFDLIRTLPLPLYAATLALVRKLKLLRHR